MSTQLKLDFSGKKTERITFAASEELKAFLERVANRLGYEDTGVLVREYAIECATRDMGKLMLMESRGEKKVVSIG